MIVKGSKVRIVAPSVAGRDNAIGQTCEVMLVKGSKDKPVYLLREASGEFGEYYANAVVDTATKPPARFVKGDRVYIIAEVASYDEVNHLVNVSMKEFVSFVSTSDGQLVSIPDRSVIKPD